MKPIKPNLFYIIMSNEADKTKCKNYTDDL